MAEMMGELYGLDATWDGEGQGEGGGDDVMCDDGVLQLSAGMVFC